MVLQREEGASILRRGLLHQCSSWRELHEHSWNSWINLIAGIYPCILKKSCPQHVTFLIPWHQIFECYWGYKVVIPHPRMHDFFSRKLRFSWHAALKISSEDIFLTSMYCSVFVSSNKICAISFTSCQKKSHLSGSKRDLTYLTYCHKIITSVQCFCPKATPQSLASFWNMELGRCLM